jgi:hypothetical protein
MSVVVSLVTVFIGVSGFFFLNKGRVLSTLDSLLIDIVQIQSLFLTETICELLQIQGKKRCYE